MNRRLKQLCALALALVMLASAGCAGDTGPKTTQPAMGRYVETEITLPADFTLVLGIHKADDGTLELLGYPEPADGPGPIYLHLYRSADGGKSWTEETPAWLDFFNAEDSEYGLESAAWAHDGTLWFYTQFTKDGEYAEAMARLDGDDLTLMDWSVPSSSDGSGMRDFRIAENGDLILDCLFEFLQVDPATGKVKNVYTASSGDGGSINDGWAVSGNILALSQVGSLIRYDLATGKEISTTPCQGPSADSWDSGDSYRVMDFGPDGKLYFADSRGIYRAVEENDTLEQLADGSLLSLSTPSVKLQSMLALEDQYLVLTWTDSVWKLLSYVYDPSVPTLPETELSVWSLAEDPLISQAISQLQKSDSSVHVAYTVGTPTDGSVTREDAIRTINTQLLAGKGPDVLVLDGLPYASYAEKGVLADLSAQLGALDATGRLLSNIANAYRQPDGKTYAVPAQFQVPMLHGSSDAMKSIKDLNTMADWLESAKGQFRSPFLFSTAVNVLQALYPSCSDSLTGADGRIDEGKLTEFLTQLKRILDLRTEVDDSDEHDDFSTEFDFGPLGWLSGHSALDLGNLVCFQGLYPAWTASDQRSDGSIETLFGGKSFLPVTTLGVSAQSKQPELAWKFIEAALSDEVQLQAVGKGIPVSTAAFEKSTVDPKERDDGVFSYYSTTFYDAEGASVPVDMVVKYPPEAYRQEMAALLKSLDAPIFYDETVLQIITENTKDFWSGTTDLDTTVNAIMQKLKLYEAE